MAKKLVYIVDDNRDYVAVIKTLLQDKYDVHMASTVEEAIALAKAQDRTARLFIDSNMGDGVDGATVLEMMRANSRYFLIPIFVSGLSDVKDKAKATAAGAVAYELKPVSAKTHEDYIEDEFVEAVAKELLELRQKAAEAKRDWLTGLPNYAEFHDMAGKELAQAVRKGTQTSLFFLDLDNLKIINDTFGHSVGNQVLSAVAHVLREADIAARWGGDEFVVLVPETDAEQALALAHQLRKRIKEIRIEHPRSDEILVDISIGVANTAELDGPATSLEKLVEVGDVAMYKDKNDKKKNGET